MTITKLWLATALLAAGTLGACSNDGDIKNTTADTPQEKGADMAPGTTIKGEDGSKIKKQADGDVKIKDADGNVVKQDAQTGEVEVKDR